MQACGCETLSSAGGDGRLLGRITRTHSDACAGPARARGRGRGSRPLDAALTLKRPLPVMASERERVAVVDSGGALIGALDARALTALARGRGACTGAIAAAG